MQTIPDLLNAQRCVPSNLQELRELLQFAFSSGESMGGLRASLTGCDVSESGWSGDDIAGDLFVDDLLRDGFRVSGAAFDGGFQPPQNLAYLRKVLLHPPRSLDSVRFRQAILAELRDQPTLRQSFERVYRMLCDLREELDAPGLLGFELSTRRRIELLIRTKETVDRVAEELGGAGSGLARIPAAAKAFQGSEAYTLLRDFVDYEGRLASVRLELQVGVDGSLRSLRIVSVEENRANRFFQGPMARLWAWLRLWWRGGRTSRDELVARVVENVFDAIDEYLVHLLVLIGHMELYLAALAFAERCEARDLPTCLPRFVDDDQPRALRGLFNPLLFDQEHPIIPCDLNVPRSDAITVITGPNSGGKSRLLQSIGLTQLLGQGGLAVPAREAELWFRPGLFVSLIQSHSADQAEGRLGTELLRVRGLFERAPHGALILLDELCSGTNPSEGEQIVVLVLGLLQELAPEAFITTHFLRFAKELGADHPELGLEFLQAQLDEALEPTFQFVPGVARTSLAERTARRLGVTREHLLALIRKEEEPESSP